MEVQSSAALTSHGTVTMAGIMISVATKLDDMSLFVYDFWQRYQIQFS